MLMILLLRLLLLLREWWLTRCLVALVIVAVVILPFDRGIVILVAVVFDQVQFLSIVTPLHHRTTGRGRLGR